jgi:hypothetical protein
MRACLKACTGNYRREPERGQEFAHKKKQVILDVDPITDMNFNLL